MAIKITCPECETALTLSDDKRGKKVRCKSCEKVLSIPSANGKVKKPAKEEEVDEQEDEEEEEAKDKPKGKGKPAKNEKSETSKNGKPAKKKKKGGGVDIPWLFIGLGAAALAIIGVCVGILIWWGPWRTDDNVAKTKDKPAGGGQIDQMMMKPPPQGNNPIGGEVVKDPKSFIGNLRARGDRLERDNEMRQIAIFYEQYCDVNKNPASRNLQTFLDFMKKDSLTIHDAIKDKHYTVNLKAKQGSEDIIVYETEEYTVGWYVFRANQQFGNVTKAELQAGTQ